MKKAYVLGGGLSGLTIGHLLSERGYDVTILEASNKLGGLCRTQSYSGINYEFGPHVVYWKTKEQEKFWKKFAPSWKPIDYYVKLSIDGGLKKESLYDFPISENNLKRIGWQHRIINPKTTFKNFEDFMLHQLGAKAYEAFVKNYNIKQWGIHPKDMSSEWASFRPLKIRSESPTRMFGEMPAGHPSSFVNTISDLSLNLHIKFMHKVIGVKLRGDNTVEKVYYEGHSTLLGRSKQALHIGPNDIVINTLPLDLFTNNELEWRGIAKYFTHINKSLTPTYSTTFPNNYPWTRIVDYKKHSLPKKERKGKDTLISFALPFSENPKRLLEQIKAADYFLKSNKIKCKNSFTSAVIKCYPISTKSSIINMDKALMEVSNWRNFYTVGRLGLFAYISMSRAVEMAYSLDSFIQKEGAIANPTARLDYYKSLRKELW